MREAVLCWYPFESGATALDLSGGALTELLESRCGSISHSQDAGGGTFDYIVVLDPADFAVETLAEFRAGLKPGGRLLLAYENPFALRYWAGKKAPNTGLPHDTLFGRGDSPLPSRSELRIRLKLAGFEGQKWYYPLTDHWFAQEIYSESCLPNEYLNQRFIPYIADDGFVRFDERDLYREVIRNGAFEFMCGAYLVEARRDSASQPCPVEYAAVTAYREPAKRFATIVRNDGVVHKKPLHPDGLESVRRSHQNHQDLAALGVDVVKMRIVDGSLVMPRMNLPTLWDYWGAKLLRGILDENEIVGHFDRIRDSILKASANGRCYWELVPANCFYDAQDDRMLFFDQESYWENASPDIALVRAMQSLRFSPVFGGDSRAEGWLAKLQDRYGLAERWAELSELAYRQTAEVFGDGLAALSGISEKAAERLAPPTAACCPRSGNQPAGKD